MATVKKTIGRSLPNGDYIEITAEERDGTDGLPPGFAVTLTGWEKRGTWTGRAAKKNGRDATFGGCGHNTILHAAPGLAPIVAVHLAGPDGVPMHAEANGWYFYSGQAAAYERKAAREGRAGYARIVDLDHDRAARALHITPAELPAGLDRAGFAAFCQGARGRWAAQASAARTVLADMVDGDGVTP